MRSIKELLKLMLAYEGYFNAGLCVWVLELYLGDIITREEKDILLTYIKNNRPFMTLYDVKCVMLGLKSGYYWEREDISPRIKWINKHIKKLEL